MPNGSTTVSNCSGCVYFSEQLYLTNVLCIPSFKFNLISVSKLIDSLGCKLTFSTNACHIQCPNSFRMIGAASLKGGLYVLAENSCTTLPSFNLSNSLDVVNVSQHVVNNFHSYSPIVWHNRFGHVFSKKMSSLQKIYSFIDSTRIIFPL